MRVELSKLKPAVIPSTWCALDAIVLEDNAGILVIRTPDDDSDKLLEVARAVDSVLAETGISYLVVPYSVELLWIHTREGGIEKLRRKVAVIGQKIIDIIWRALLW